MLRETYGLLTNRPPPYFFGWLMSTDHEHPWVDDHDWQDFRRALEEVKAFELTVVEREDLDALRWRHWIVAYAVRHAVEHTGFESISAVECGSGDGMSALFVLTELEAARRPYEVHLFDAWAAMEAERLDSSELDHVGRYADLQLDATRRNLARFEHVMYHKGYIPEVFTDPPPDDLAFLHIDLNAAAPTVGSLEHFWPALRPGSVVLFDDYGWRAYHATKAIVDDWFANRPGSLLKLPTGQAMYFR